MITVISGTNRIGNTTIKVAEHYFQVLKNKGVEADFFDLQHLPDDFILASKHTEPKASSKFYKIQERCIIPAQKLLFVMPEYNGSIPGILKLFLDSCDIKKAFYFKKACLTGLSSGRAGNLRGLDHLTNILNYLKMEVMPNKLPISRIMDIMDEDGVMIDNATIKVIEAQVDQFIKY